jgi:hypothetical protein
MPEKQPEQPLRGEAAWRAEKARIASNNEAAYKRGRERRADADAKAEKRRVAAERADDAQLPVQPSPDD